MLAFDARGHLTLADKAARAKDWATAATEYSAANAITPSAAAMEGLAGAEYERKRVAEAYAAYAQLLKTYGDKIGKRNQAAAEARLKELSVQTGSLSIRVTEPGAEVFVDDKSIGMSPILGLARVSIGVHRVKITKEGFAPVEQLPNVTAASTLVVDAQLTREAKTGHVTVKEKGGQPMRVLLDGVDVGPAPWEGDVDPGPHDIAGRSPNAAAPPQKVEVVRGQASVIELGAVATSAHVEISVSDPRAIVFIDGKPAGEGSFSGDLAPGEHTLVVSREGFERFEKKIVLAEKDSVKETIALKKTETSVVVDTRLRSFEGIYGGFGLTGVLMPNGSGNELDTRCHDVGAASCETPFPLGAGLFGYMGYSWNPVGLELMLGGLFDVARATAHFPGETVAGGSPNANPLATGTARTEEFSFFRAGGLAAVRARASFQTPTVRGSFAGGVGVSYKHVVMVRNAESTDGNKLQDGYKPDGASYVSPALTFDVSVGWRLGEATAITLGGLMWIESSASDARAPGDLNRTMARTNPAAVAPIPTPPYQMTSGAQLFIGPYLGMQFGP